MRIYNAHHAKDFYSAICFIRDLYKINAKADSRDRKEYFEKFAFFTEIFFKAMTVTFVLVGVAFVLSPFYYYYIEGKLLPAVPLYFPAFDEVFIWRSIKLFDSVAFFESNLLFYLIISLHFSATV